MPSELEIDGEAYRTGQLNAKQQFHVARRLGPVIAKIGALARSDGRTGADPVAPQPTNGAEGSNGSEEPGQAVDQGLFLSTVAESIAELSDKDCDYIIAVCMSVVQRRQGERFVPCWNKQADIPQFADINVSTLMQLTYAVIQDNLGSFIPAQSQAGLPTLITPLNTP